MPDQEVGEPVAAVDRGDLPTVEQGDCIVDPALTLADRRKQTDRPIRVEAAAAPRAVAAVVDPDPSGEQRGGHVVAAGDRRHVDQRGGERPVVDVRHQQG
ncbi:hypothetical protein [Kitasatospora sp. NPDC085879]|uniref:hypothetical protein n=1 Tax=Kitasatospora sp. NPDC085879 TaxID=3154769 RepID=UPI00341BC452